MAEKFNLDFGRFTRDEATELCAYHLRMASSFFQLVPDDSNVSLNNEIDRQCKDDIASVSSLPAKTWADEMWAAYEKMKDND